MRGYVDIPAPLTQQFLDVAVAGQQKGWDPMAWFFNRPKDPQPIDEEQRVQGLAAYWAEAKVSFAFWDNVPDLDWDAAFRQFLPRVRSAREPRDYYRLLREFASLLRDGHTHVLPPLWLAATEGAPAIRLYPVEGQPVVVDGVNLPPGTAVTAVNGVAADTLVAERVAKEPGSTDHDRLQKVVSRLLDGPLGSTVEVGIRRANGEHTTVALPRTAAVAPPLVERQELGGGRVLVRINSWQEPEVVDEFHKAFPDFADIRCLVIDLRRNRGGNSGNADKVLARLIDRSAYGVTSQVPMYAGAMRSWGLPRPMLTLAADAVQPDPDRPRYLGPIAVLTGFNTYSAAENFCATFRGSARGPLVGELTGGSTGQPVLFDLPGGGVGVICAKRDTFPDGTTFVGKGIQPDVPVAPTIQGVAAGRDEVLEAALAALEGTPHG
ncbi:MAG: S41 family peptidase [Symbiobacteriia bacterium]